MLQHVHSIQDLRRAARKRVPRFVFEYIDSGVEDEVTLRRNADVLRDLALVPRTLVDTQARTSAIRLFGQDRPTPLIIAPTGFNGLAHAGGDVALACAAARFAVPFTLSSFANQSLEAVAAASGVPPWFQLYVLEDFAITEALLARALAAGSEVLVLTTDANVQSLRERQRRCYRKPGSLTLGHTLECFRHPAWGLDLLRTGKPTFANLHPYLPPGQASAAGGAHFVVSQLRPTLTWRDVARIRTLWSRTLLVKGVLHAEDAQRARDAGADGVVLSNHGGRQLEGAISAVEALAGARARLGPDYPLIVDGGFTRGSHVIKAMALGASAVMVGRATLYGVAAAGQRGAEHALALLTAEIDRNLGMLGLTALPSGAQDILAS